jgi:hypothetical protein
MQRVGIIKGRGPSIGRRVLAFIAVTWLPLLIFTSIEGHAIGATPRASFLLDFATYARFFVAVPLIFAAETIVGPRILAAGLRFIQSDIVQPADHPAFHAAALHARSRRDAALPEILFLVAALLGAWFLTSSFDVVRQMSVFPAGRTQIFQVAAIACLPGVPLAFLVLPIAEVLKLFAGVIT